MDEFENEQTTLLTTQEIMDAIRYVNEGGKEEDLAQIVTYSKRMVFIAVNTHVSSREIAEQYEGFSSFISMGDHDGLLRFMRTNMPLMELRTSEDPLLQGRTAIAFLASVCANAARAGGLPIARCLSRDGLDWAMAAISDIDIESLPFIWTVWTVIHFTRRGDVY